MPNPTVPEYSISFVVVLFEVTSSPRYDFLIYTYLTDFLFTPLLAAASTGTFDFSAIVEPIRLKPKQGYRFIYANVSEIDFENKKVFFNEISNHTFLIF